MINTHFARIQNQKKKDDSNASDATVESDTDVVDIPITVHDGDEKFIYHCANDKPLSASLFIPLEQLIGEGGQCILKYESMMGPCMLDRKKTPSFYGMTYDESVYVIGIIHPRR